MVRAKHRGYYGVVQFYPKVCASVRYRALGLALGLALTLALGSSEELQKI